ncbi:MAG: butyrate kinase [Calditrichaeota bacterium]|nr:MAG: butyrate kinase [Calditrichota bacterium]
MGKIFAVNPGSTSTKVALFEGDKKMFANNVAHSIEDLKPFKTINDQFDFRRQAIEKVVIQAGIDLSQVSAFVGRGGLLRPIAGGTYEIDDLMLDDLRNMIGGEHASNLGALLASFWGKLYDRPAFIVDPVVVDEMEEIARFSGHPLFPRKSIFHALNQKSVARAAAEQLGKPYEELYLIVAHLGGGISVGAHRCGRVIDVNNALDGEGPFSPERTGSLPVGDLVRYCFSGQAELQQVLKMIKGQGGIAAYLGTNDMRDILQLISQGDVRAELIYQAMAYQISKQIGEMAVCLKGKVNAIILTGGITYDKLIVKLISNYIAFLGPIIVIPGEEEMQALVAGALRVLNGMEQAKNYTKQIQRS